MWLKANEVEEVEAPLVSISGRADFASFASFVSFGGKGGSETAMGPAQLRTPGPPRYATRGNLPVSRRDGEKGETPSDDEASR